MPRFQYTGRTASGKVRGTVNANSEREAVSRLRSGGVRVIDILEVKETVWTKDIHLGPPVKLVELVLFLRQFATLVSAGVSVIDSVSILAAQVEGKVFKGVLYEVEKELREGQSLSKAFQKHPKVFSVLFISMIQAGETSGNLDDTLERLAVQYEKQHALRQKVVSAMAYPILIGVISIAVVIFLLAAVVPIFEGLFADFGGELPVLTRFVLAMSNWTQSFWYIWSGLLLALILAFTKVRKTQKGKWRSDYAMLKVPLIGKLLQKAAIARFTRTLSSLLKSAVPILEALRMAEQTVGNEIMRNVLRESRELLEVGEPMATALKNHWSIPPLVAQMVAVGEQTGALDTMLQKVADFYEQEVEVATDRFKAIIEPVLIVLLAVLVGTIVLAILIPMFELFNQLNTY